ncbi:hypothetical protein DWX45_14435 [Erysipelotrichaceae bacterium AF19-24AC]|nr:hypothetical protein DWX45_14435 [Erysipelotrichaceae bacterium AF19-24AC]
MKIKKVKDAKSSETQDDGASFYIVAIPLRSSLEYKGYKCLFYMLRKLKGYCLFTGVHIERCICKYEQYFMRLCLLVHI